jgi:hypothetical protein
MSVLLKKLQKKTSLYNLLKILGIVAYFTLFAAWMGRSFLHGSGIASVEDMTPLVSLRQLISYIFGSWFDATQTDTFRSKYILFYSLVFYAPLTGYLTIFLSALAGICNYLSIYLLAKLIFKSKFNFYEHAIMILATSNITLFVLITHISAYNSVGFAISLMGLSISLFIYALLSDSIATTWKQILLCLVIAVLLQWTASLHVLVVYFFAIGAITLWAVLLWPKRMRRIVTLWTMIIVFFVLPFGYFILQVTPLAEAADATYITLPVLSLGSRTPLDNFAVSFYSLISIFVGSNDATPPPQPWFIFQTLGMLSIFILAKQRYMRNRVTYGILGLYILSLFFSGGVRSPISGYQLALAVIPNIPIPALKSAILLLINTLRFPFRWMYLLFYCWGILLALFGIELYRWVKARIHYRALANLSPVILFAGLIIMPYLGEPFSLSSTFSGNYGVNFEPMTIPGELIEIRSILHQRPLVGKLVVWPSPGSEQISFGDKVYLLNDAFYDIFFDVPAILGTFGTPHVNFLSVQLGYQLAKWQESGVGAYLATQGVEYLLVREDSIEISQQTETSHIRSWLEEQRDLELAYAGQRYALFRVEGLNETLLPSKAVTFYVAPFREPVRLLQSGVSPSSTVMIDLSAGDINRETIQKIREDLPPERVTFYFPNEENRQDALLSILTASTGVVGSIDAVEGMKSQLEMMVTDFWFPQYGGVYTQLSDVFGRYGALEGKANFAYTPGVSESLPLKINKSGQYSIFVKLYTSPGTRLSFQLDGEPEQQIDVPGGPDYRYVKVFDTWLTADKHNLVFTLQDGSVLFSAAYAVLNSDLAAQTTWFDEVTRNLTFTSQPELISYLDSLSMPEKSQVFFLSKYVYNPEIIARTGDELIAPVPAWYSQIAYILSQPHMTQELEIGFANADDIRNFTIGYMSYILLSLVVITVCLIFTPGILIKRTS